MEEKTLEESLAALLEKTQNSSSLSVQEICDILSEKGRLLILIFLSLPFCQPIILPGISVVFGLLIAIIGFRMIFGKHHHLPKIITKRTISSKTVEKIASKLLQVFNKLRKFIHPRWQVFCQPGFMQKTHGFVLFLLGLILSLPLPIPLSNLSAGWSIFLLGLGILERDGLFIAIGYLSFLLTLAFFFVVFISVNSFI